MNLISNIFVVAGFDALHDFSAERWEVGGREILFGLIRTFCTGNRASDGVKHQNPAQRHLGHGHAFWQEFLQFGNRL